GAMLGASGFSASAMGVEAAGEVDRFVRGRGGALRTGANRAARRARSRVICGACKSTSSDAVCAWSVGRTCVAVAQGMAGFLRKMQPPRKKASEEKVRDTSSGALRRRSECLDRGRK